MTVTSPRSAASPRSVASPRGAVRSPRGTIPAYSADEAKELLLQRAVAEAPSVMRAFYRLEVRLEAERQQAEKQLESLETRLLQATLEPAPVAARWEEMRGQLDALTEMVQAIGRRQDTLEVSHRRSAEVAENCNGHALVPRLEVLNDALATHAAKLLEGEQCQQDAEQNLQAELRDALDRIQVVEQILRSSFNLVDQTRAAWSVAEQLGQLWPVAEEVEMEDACTRQLDYLRVSDIDLQMERSRPDVPSEPLAHGMQLSDKLFSPESQQQQKLIAKARQHFLALSEHVTEFKTQLAGSSFKQDAITFAEDTEEQAQTRAHVAEPVTRFGVLETSQMLNDSSGIRSAVAHTSFSGDLQSASNDLVDVKQDEFQSMVDDWAGGVENMRVQLQSLSDGLASLRASVAEKLSESHLQERLQPLTDKLAEVSSIKDTCVSAQDIQKHLQPVLDEIAQLRGMQNESTNAVKALAQFEAGDATPKVESQPCNLECELALAKEEASQLVSHAVLQGQLQVLSSELAELKIHTANTLSREELDSKFQTWSDELASKQAHASEELAILRDHASKSLSKEEVKSKFQIWSAEVERRSGHVIETESLNNVQSQLRLLSDEFASLRGSHAAKSLSAQDMLGRMQSLSDELAQLKTLLAESASKVDVQNHLRKMSEELAQLKTDTSETSSTLEMQSRWSEELELLKNVPGQLKLLSNEVAQLKCQPRQRPSESVQLQTSDPATRQESTKSKASEKSPAMVVATEAKTKEMVQGQFQILLDELAQLKRDAVESVSKADVQDQLQALSAELAEMKVGAVGLASREEERAQLLALSDELAQLRHETVESAPSQDVRSQLQTLSEEVAQWKARASEVSPGVDVQSQVQVLAVELDQLRTESASRDDIDTQLHAVADVQRQLQALSDEVAQLRLNAPDLELAPTPKKCCSFRS